MSALARVELQAEVGQARKAIYDLVSTSTGLARWLDAAELDATVGGAYRFGMGGAVAVGTVVALAAPQHISYAWDWQDESLGLPSVVAFDLIDHGSRTHLTMRHVGFPSVAQRELHTALWQHWFGRLVRAADEVAPGQAE